MAEQAPTPTPQPGQATEQTPQPAAQQPPDELSAYKEKYASQLEVTREMDEGRRKARERNKAFIDVLSNGDAEIAKVLENVPTPELVDKARELLAAKQGDGKKPSKADDGDIAVLKAQNEKLMKELSDRDAQRAASETQTREYVVGHTLHKALGDAGVNPKHVEQAVELMRRYVRIDSANGTIKTVVDTTALKEAGYDLASLVSADRDGITLESAARAWLQKNPHYLPGPTPGGGTSNLGATGLSPSTMTAERFAKLSPTEQSEYAKLHYGEQSGGGWTSR